MAHVFLLMLKDELLTARVIVYVKYLKYFQGLYRLNMSWRAKLANCGNVISATLVHGLHSLGPFDKQFHFF